MNGVGEQTVKIYEINQELKKIALNNQPFSNTEYFDQLIQNEKDKRQTGWQDRIDQYTRMKGRIELHSNINAKGGLDVSKFITLNKKEIDELNDEQLKELANKQTIKVKTKTVLDMGTKKDESRCTIF